MLRWAVSVLVLTTFSFITAAACTGESPPAPAATPDIKATVTAMVEAIPTQTPYPTSTASPTYTPVPTYTAVPPYPTYTQASPATPYPTYTPAPTAEPYPTYTPAPTHTPAPTATPYPTPEPLPTAMPSPTPPAPTWRGSGHWYRDTDYEMVLDAVYRDIAPWVEYDVGMATLDAGPESRWADLLLTLGCVNDTPIGYLFPYTFVVPTGMDTYTVGIWDHTAGVFVDHLGDYPITLTDDGSGLFITNRVVLRRIVNLLEKAVSGLPEGQRLVAGMWEGGADDGGLWTDFEPAGWRDASRYLGCH